MRIQLNSEIKNVNKKNAPLYLLMFICIILIMFQQSQIGKILQQIDELQKVYIYDLEETLLSIRIDELNKEFEAKINILNDEVSSAQEKISTLKDGKIKDDFSDVYLKSLKLKRDTMIQEYTKTLQGVTDNINQALTLIAQEKKTPVIFDKRAVAAQTSNVINITQELVQKIRIDRPSVLDNY